MKSRVIFSPQEVISADKLNLACQDVINHAPEHTSNINKLKKQLDYISKHQIIVQENDKLILKAIYTSLSPDQLKQCVHFSLFYKNILSSHQSPVESIKDMPIPKELILNEMAGHLDYATIAALQLTNKFFYFNGVLDTQKISALLRISHTEPEVISEAIKLLFDWINKVEKETFFDVLSTIIIDYYETNTLNVLPIFSQKEFLMEYLKWSRDDNANKLAFILSAREHADISFNTQLIKQLITLFVTRTINNYSSSGKDENLKVTNTNLLRVEHAYDQGFFDEKIYTFFAINYAKKDLRFTHLYSKDALTRFHQWMYKWLDGLNRQAFKEILKDALNKYQPYNWNFFSKKIRSSEVNKILENKDDHANSVILSTLFTEGQFNSNSFNTILFNQLLRLMRGNISLNNTLDLDAIIIMKVGENKKHVSYYLRSLRDYAQHQLSEVGIEQVGNENEKVIPLHH